LLLLLHQPTDTIYELNDPHLKNHHSEHQTSFVTTAVAITFSSKHKCAIIINTQIFWSLFYLPLSSSKSLLMHCHCSQRSSLDELKHTMRQ
jgi:hypothetical protein